MVPYWGHFISGFGMYTPDDLENGPVLLLQLQNLGYRGSVDSSQFGWLAPAPGVTDAVYSVPESTQTWV